MAQSQAERVLDGTKPSPRNPPSGFHLWRPLAPAGARPELNQNCFCLGLSADSRAGWRSPHDCPGTPMSQDTHVQDGPGRSFHVPISS